MGAQGYTDGYLCKATNICLGATAFAGKQFCSGSNNKSVPGFLSGPVLVCGPEPMSGSLYGLMLDFMFILWPGLLPGVCYFTRLLLPDLMVNGLDAWKLFLEARLAPWARGRPFHCP